MIEIINRCNVDELFNSNLAQETWVWVNEEILKDLLMNILDYDSYEEESLIDEIEETKHQIIDIIQQKMRQVGWIKVNQWIFEELTDEFKATEDIETYIFADRRFYMKAMISKMKELQWVLRAMAIDTYQNLNSEGLSLNELYHESFHENYMILETLLAKKDYEIVPGKWKLILSNKILYFYKNNKERRQWAEGHADFIFYELNK